MIRMFQLLPLFLLMVVHSAFPQSRMITGVVMDTTGETLPGVTILVVGTTRGMSTDINGSYTLQVEPSDTLEFRFVGMQTTRVAVGNRTNIDVILESEMTMIEEFVVIGYGMQTKESVVGSIAQTGGEDVRRGATGGTDLATSLTGLLPGVITIQTSGIPGGGSNWDNPAQIFIRGQTTWNNAQPLVLVDGVERLMMDIDPNEVESISVLKDASATAVFGVKGANGVILITTKRGKTGKPVLSYESLASAVRLSKKYPVLGSYDALSLKNLAIINELSIDENSWRSFLPAEILNYYKTQEYPELFPDVNWQDESTKDFALSQRHNLNVSGGTEFVNYFLSIGYLQESDILSTEDFGQGYDPSFRYDRYNFRSNLDFDITKTTKFSFNLGGYYGKQQQSSGPSGSRLRGISGQPPDLYPVRYSDGTWAHYASFDRYDNPIYHLNMRGITVDNRTGLNTDFMLNQKLDMFTKGLSVSAKLSFDNRFLSDGPSVNFPGDIRKYIHPDIIHAKTAEDSAAYIHYTYPTTDSHGYNYVLQPVGLTPERMRVPGETNRLYRSLFYQASVNYSRRFDNHSFGGLLLFNRRENTTGSEFTNYREDWVGRATYDYRKRYFFEFNAAYNGSEKFDRQYRFGFFPSLAGGWILSNEDFFKNAMPFVDIFKFRYSWGKIGNDGGIDRWQYIGGWARSNRRWAFGDPVLNPAYNFYFETIVANPTIRWETAEKQNIGLETAFLNNLVQFNFDYFWEHRYDMFIDRTDRLSNIVFGTDLPAANVGELKSNGWEAELKFSKASARSRIYANFHWAYAANEILYREDPDLRPFYQKQAGFPIGQRRTQIASGIIQSWDEVYTGVVGESNVHLLPGDFRIIDFNADGIINADDVIPYQYSRYPQFNYGLTTGFRYKNLSGMIQFYGVYNVSDQNAYDEFHENYSLTYPMHREESWSPEMGRTDGATYPHLRLNTSSPRAEYWVWDYSYLKIQTAEIAYSFESAWLINSGINQLRVFISGNNIWIWNQLLEDRDHSVHHSSYPMTKRVNLGVNIRF